MSVHIWLGEASVWFLSKLNRLNQITGNKAKDTFDNFVKLRIDFILSRKLNILRKSKTDN